MPSPAVIVVLAVVLLTALTVALLIVVSLRHLRALMHGVGTLRTAVLPQLQVLAEETAAAQAQLEALSRARQDGADGDRDRAAHDGDAWSQGYTDRPEHPTAGTRT